jgi:hypothetical protein
MTAARRAGSFVWEAIEEHCITLVAKSPLILLGHGYNLLQVTVVFDVLPPDTVAASYSDQFTRRPITHFLWERVHSKAAASIG